MSLRLPFPADAQANPPPFSHPELLVVGDESAWAAFSKDQGHRYLLARRWGSGPVLPWILNNPSKAGVHDDQTVKVGREFTRRAG